MPNPLRIMLRPAIAKQWLLSAVTDRSIGWDSRDSTVPVKIQTDSVGRLAGIAADLSETHYERRG
jgi:hypothetical protein